MVTGTVALSYPVLLLPSPVTICFLDFSKINNPQVRRDSPSTQNTSTTYGTAYIYTYLHVFTI